MSDNDLDIDNDETGVSPTLNDLRKQASETVGTAKDALASVATEARAKLSEILDRQKMAGADQLSSLVRAVQAAAGELDVESPQTARLVRVAASSVDRFAGDLRSKDVPDILAAVTTFARRQPAVVFAGSVIVGFVLARFLKSDGPVERSTGLRQPGFRAWSAAHRDEPSD